MPKQKNKPWKQVTSHKKNFKNIDSKCTREYAHFTCTQNFKTQNQQQHKQEILLAQK